MAIIFESSDLMYTGSREMSREDSRGGFLRWHVLQFRDVETKRYTEMADWSKDLGLTASMEEGCQYYVRGYVNFVGGPRSLKAFLVITQIAVIRDGQRYDPFRGTEGVAVIMKEKSVRGT